MIHLSKCQLTAALLAAVLSFACASSEEDTRAAAPHGAQVLIVGQDGVPHTLSPGDHDLHAEHRLHARDDELRAREQLVRVLAPSVGQARGQDGLAPRLRLEQLARLHPGPRLGVSVEASPDGLTVKEVEDGSLAQAAGVQPGDVLLRIGDRKIHTVDDVRMALGAYDPGDEVTVAVIRPDAGVLELKAPLPEPTVLPRGPLVDGSRGGFLGVEMDDFDSSSTRPRSRTPDAAKPDDAAEPDDSTDPDEATDAGPETDGAPADGGPGVRVAGVVPESAAWYAGLEIGDRLLAIDGQSIAGGQDLVGIVASRAPGTLVELRVLRDGAEQTLKVRLGQRGIGTTLHPLRIPSRGFFRRDSSGEPGFSLRFGPDDGMGWGPGDAFDFDELLHGLPGDLSGDLGDGSHSLRVVIENDHMTVERDGMTTHYSRNEEGDWVPAASSDTPAAPRSR